VLFTVAEAPGLTDHSILKGPKLETGLKVLKVVAVVLISVAFILTRARSLWILKANGTHLPTGFLNEYIALSAIVLSVFVATLLARRVNKLRRLADVASVLCLIVMTGYVLIEWFGRV